MSPSTPSTSSRPTRLGLGARARERLTFSVLALGVGAWALLQSLVLPVLPTLQRALHTDQTNVTWLLTAYLLSAAIFTPIFGRLGDMTGRRNMLIVGLGALAFGSLLGAVAGNLAVMIVARVIQGIGGGVLPLAFGLVRDAFAPERVKTAIGGIASISAVGVGVGLVLAGPIVDALDYHWLFWLPMIITTVAAVAARLFVPAEQERTAGESVNWLAAILLTVWLVGFLVAVSEAPRWGWGSGRVLGLLAVTAAVVPLWVLVEARATDPLVDMRMMTRRPVWTCNTIAFLLGFGMYAAFSFIPEYLQTPSSVGYGFDATVTLTGFLLLPITVGSFFTGIAAGRLDAALGPRRLLVGATFTAVAGFVVLAAGHSSELGIAIALGLIGSGSGLAVAGMANVVVAAVPPEQTGIATGMNTNIRTIGGAVGAAVTASIIASSAHRGGLPSDAGYTHGFATLAAGMAIGAGFAFAVPAARRRSRSVLHTGSEHGELAVLASAPAFIEDRGD